MSRSSRTVTRAAAALAGLLVLGGAASASAVPTEVQVGGVVAGVTSFPGAVLRPGDPLPVMVEVTNRSGLPVEGAAVAVAVTEEPLADTAALTGFVDGDDAALRTVARADVGTMPAAGGVTASRLPAGASATVDATAASEALALPDDAWGVYGVVVRLETVEGWTTVERAALTWAGTDIPSLRIASLAVAAGQGTHVAAVMDAADLTGVSVAVDPTTPSTAGSSAADLAGRDAFVLPAANPDLVSLAHAEDEALLPYAIDRARAATAGVAGTQPWLALTTVLDRSTAAYALANGAAALLLDGDAAKAAAAQGDEALRGIEVTAGTVPVLVPDAALSEAVRDPEASAPSIAVGEAALRAGAGTGTVLVSPGLGWGPTGDGPSATLAALLDASFVDTVSVTDLVAEGPEAGLTAPRFADEEEDLSPATIMGLAGRLDRLDQLGATVEEPSQVLAATGRTLLGPLATEVRSSPNARQARASYAVAATDETLNALGIAAGSDVNLIASSGSVPVTVRNDLDVDATVTVDMTSFSPNLQIRQAPTVTIPAGSSQSVLVDVEAVSSADVTASIVLRNAEGAPIGDRVTMSVHVRADWGNAVTAVFTGGLVLLLVMGVVRTVRRGRNRETREGPRPAAEAGGDEE